MLADAGPNARQVLDTAIQSGGPGSVSARNAIDARAARGADDLTTALDDNLGAPKSVFSARKEIADQARPIPRDAYGGPTGAYAQPINYAAPEGRHWRRQLPAAFRATLSSQPTD